MNKCTLDSLPTGPFWLSIVCHLDYLDVCAFAIAWKPLTTHIGSLRSYFDKIVLANVPPAIIAEMKRVEGSFLTGSALLKCILSHDKWEPGDIDVVVPVDITVDWEGVDGGPIIQLAEEIERIHFCGIVEGHRQDKETHDEYKIKTDQFYFGSRKKEVGGVTLNVLYVQRPHQFDYVLRFDMPIVKNMWSPSAGLEIAAKDDILTRLTICDNTYSHTFENTLVRVKKYQERGFTFAYIPKKKRKREPSISNPVHSQ